MSTLVIQNNLIGGGTDILYRDALVSKGTLSCMDFSNLGCLDLGNLTTVKDLALEAKNGLLIPNDVLFKITDRGTVPALTSKKGYPIVNLGSYSSTANDSGLQIKGLSEYLFTKQPHSIFSIWLDCSATNRTNLSRQEIVRSGDPDRENIRIIGGTNNLVSFRFGGIGFDNIDLGTGVVQLSVEYIDSTQPVKCYVNGKFHSNAATNAYGFKNGSNPLNVGANLPGSNTNNNIYRWLLEDLTFSGRTALDVVSKDYNYVNAINEFSNIIKRPFANIAA